jgi:hypothetical protein
MHVMHGSILLFPSKDGYLIRCHQALATAQSDANQSRSKLALTCETIDPLALPETDEVLQLIST